MEQLIHLGLLAELSVALIGFIAIFSVFARTDGRFNASDRHFVQAMVLDCVLVAVLAVVPRILWTIVDPETTWNISLHIGAFLGVLLGVYIARDQLQMPREEAETINLWWHIGGWTWGSFAFFFVVAAYLGVITPVAGYFGAASMLLINGLHCFIVIVFRRFF